VPVHTAPSAPGRSRRGLLVAAVVVLVAVIGAVVVLTRGGGGDKAASTTSSSSLATTTTLAVIPTGASGRGSIIDSITIDGDHYSVQFRTTGFDPDLNGGPQAHHVHFFFDSVPQELAGTNDPRNTGDWILYDKPNPFTKYKLSDLATHKGATKMCILVANNLHQIELGTGNCVALPSS